MTAADDTVIDGETPFARALRLVGGPTRMAELCGVKRPSVYKWIRQVPAERAIAIEKATGGKVTRHQLRPDIYPLKRRNHAVARAVPRAASGV